MALPIRTTLEDIQTVCKYLSTKPTGASILEAKTVVKSKYLDGRKITALRFWKLINENEGKYKLSDIGRRAIKNNGAELSKSLCAVIKAVPPYNAIIERIYNSREESLNANDVASHWYDHFKDHVSDNDKIINDQAVCFFQLVEGANLGKITIGRKGSPTRINFNFPQAQAFVTGQLGTTTPIENSNEVTDVDFTGVIDTPSEEVEQTNLQKPSFTANRVFITHGNNQKILDQLKEIVRYGKLEPVVAKEHETVSKPVPEKVLDDMRSCQAGIIHVASEKTLLDESGNPHHKINENVLIEIGAAMALYKRNFILLVEEGLTLPSNLKGLYECRYAGENLDGDSTMKLLKAFNEFSNA